MPETEFKQLIREDLYRCAGELGTGAFLRTWRYEVGFRFTVLMRLCRILHRRPATRYGAYHLVAFFYHCASVRHGLQINFTTEIGGGLYLPHALNIVVNRRCKIGRNCNLSQGVTLGVAHRGERMGTPVIGDNVYIAPGAVIFGEIEVSDGAAVGANCVVTKAVPENGVVVGVPGKLISHNGSGEYITQTLSSTSENIKATS